MAVIAGGVVTGGGEREVTGLREGWAAQSTEAAETTAVYEITTTNLFFVHFVIFTFILYFLMKIK